jgi:RNA polymerase sigma factor (sigma-70 family)
MASPLEPTGDRLPVAEVAGLLSGSSVDDLRDGEQGAFLRFFEAFRGPVYDFVLALTRGSDDAAAITRDVIVTTYRQILLHDGVVDLRPWVYRVAVAACRDRRAERRPTAGARDESPAVAFARGNGGELGRRFRQALLTLDERQYMALLLHDVHGLRHDEAAAVLGISTDAAAALLFRAREAFLKAFDQLRPQHHGGGACRLAEQVAASAVGRALPDPEVRRLTEHAAYCKPCRNTMRSWGGGVVGLALFLKEAPLPASLATAPIFGTADEPSAVLAARPPAAGAATLGIAAATFGQIGKALASRAAAYTVAAASLAAVAGMGIYVSQQEAQPPQYLGSAPTPAAIPTRPAVRPTAVSAEGRTLMGRSLAAATALPTPFARATAGRSVTTTSTKAIALVVPSSPDRATSSTGAATSGGGSGSGGGTAAGGTPPSGGGTGTSGSAGAPGDGAGGRATGSGNGVHHRAPARNKTHKHPGRHHHHAAGTSKDSGSRHTRQRQKQAGAGSTRHAHRGHAGAPAARHGRHRASHGKHGSRHGRRDDRRSRRGDHGGGHGSR